MDVFYIMRLMSDKDKSRSLLPAFIEKPEIQIIPKLTLTETKWTVRFKDLQGTDSRMTESESKAGALFREK